MLDLKAAKIIFFTVLIIWMAIATNYIELTKPEASFLQHHVWARILIIFIISFTAADLSERKFSERIIMASITTLLYYLIAELPQY